MMRELKPEEIEQVKAMNPHPLRDRLLTLLELLANTLPEKKDYDFIMSGRELVTKEVDVALPRMVWELLDKYAKEIGDDAIRAAIGEAIMSYVKATDRTTVMVALAFMEERRQAAMKEGE